ncbi:Uncharacterised protein [Mycobacteroides abscessus subsp. abscessus]|nr:Uncharacterised protein [Mycobacteroides abscessus subsp. abscessus]
MRRGRGGQDPVIRESELAVEERQAQHHQCADDDDGNRNSARHNPFGGPVPEALRDVLGDGFRPSQDPADQAAHVQGVDPVAQQGDYRRDDDQRGDGANEDDGYTGVSERFEEVHREQDQRYQGQRNRQRREQHGPSGRGHGQDQRFIARFARIHLLAIATDDQQGVVDRQRQSHCYRKVQREHGHIGDIRQPAQYRHGADDGKHSDYERQQGRVEAAEYPYQHHKADRNRDRLHNQQVLLGLGNDLVVERGDTAGLDRYPVTVHRERLDELCRVLLRVVLAPGQPGDDQSGLAIGAQQFLGYLWRRRPGRGQVDDHAGAFELALQICCDGTHLRTLDALLAGKHEDQGLVADIKLVPESLGHIGRFGVRVLLTTGGQMLGHRNAEEGRRDRDEQRHPENEAGRRDHRSSQTFEHHRAFRRRITALSYQR